MYSRSVSFSRSSDQVTPSNSSNVTVSGNSSFSSNPICRKMRCGASLIIIFLLFVIDLYKSVRKVEPPFYCSVNQIKITFDGCFESALQAVPFYKLPAKAKCQLLPDGETSEQSFRSIRI